jgi:hypothetical protein
MRYVAQRYVQAGTGWDDGEDVTRQVRGALGHAPAAAAWAHRAALARERHEAIQPAAGTVKPRKPARQAAAAQEPAKLLFDESRQLVSVVGAGRVGAKGLEVVPHDLIQHALGDRS